MRFKCATRSASASTTAPQPCCPPPSISTGTTGIFRLSAVAIVLPLEILTKFRKGVFNILGSIAEFERELIRSRTSEGRQRAKARGVKFGRKPALNDFQVNSRL